MKPINNDGSSVTIKRISLVDSSVVDVTKIAKNIN